MTSEVNQTRAHTRTDSPSLSEVFRHWLDPPVTTRTEASTGVGGLPTREVEGGRTCVPGGRSGRYGLGVGGPNDWGGGPERKWGNRTGRNRVRCKWCRVVAPTKGQVHLPHAADEREGRDPGAVTWTVRERGRTMDVSGGVPLVCEGVGNSYLGRSWNGRRDFRGSVTVSRRWS